MKWVLVYKGKGMYEHDTEIVMRAMNEFVDTTVHQVDIVSAEDIIKGRLAKDVALLAIGGGYDLGLIEALGACGMKNIWDFVMSGGSYLGICSGAYFACDRIEFDKSGPQEVVGERFLKFYPGVGIGPLFKPYDCKNRSGAEAVTVDYHYLVDTGEPSQKSRLNKESQALQVESLKQSLDTGELSQRSGINKESQALQEESLKQSLDTGEPSQRSGINKESQALQEESLKQSLDTGEPSQRSGINKESQALQEESLKQSLDTGEPSQRSGINKESQALQEESLKQSLDTGEPSQRSGINKESQALQEESLKQSLDTGEPSQRSGINKESQSPKSFKGCQSSDTADNDTKKRHDFQTCCGKSLWRECDINNIFSCKVYFNGGCCFNCPESEDSVTVLSHYLDLPDSPAAIVRCKVGAGMAILSGVHLEYEASDIDDGDTLVTDIIPCLKNSVKERKLIIKSLLKQLSITPK